MSATWFRCDPSKLIGALSGMSPEQGYVYTMVLMRIYEVGGPINDDEHVLARRTGYAVKKVAEAIQWLIQRDKVQRLDNGLLDSRSTHEELAYREKLIKDAQNAGNSSGRKRSKVSFKKSKQNQRNEATPVERPLNDRATLVERPSTDIEVDIDTTANAVVGASRRNRQKPKTRIEPDTQPTLADREAAAREGLEGQSFRLEWQTFRDHHVAKGSVMADWSAAWRTWLSKRDQFNRIGKFNERPNAKGSLVDAGLSLIRKLDEQAEQSMRAATGGPPRDDDARLLSFIGSQRS